MWLVKPATIEGLPLIYSQLILSNLLNHEDIFYKLYISGFQTPVYQFGHANYVLKLKKNWCKTTSTI